MDLTKQELRQRSSQLNDLMCEWDPIGIMDNPDAPRDEYNCLVGPLLTKLQAGAGEAEIADYLRQEIVDHFGLSAAHYDFLSVAKRVREWFLRAWSVRTDFVTVFVALLDEGVDVWRPVRARSLGRHEFRLVGVLGDVSDELWQFPPGAIVRCEMKRFPDGNSGLVAVEQLGTG